MVVGAHRVVVDLFAGGGGASEGIRRALGVSPVLAVNHCAAAIRMHEVNHPNTVHLQEDVFEVRPRRPGRKAIDLLWASPDCTHHSRAKGGAPRLTGRRMLAWAVIEWARAVSPRCIALENVPEFENWGPLDEAGQPIKARAGETFRAFVDALRMAGYRVEWRCLVAADFGAPTTRRRLYLLARNDGAPIAWPEPTHGPGRSQPWRTAADIIDWSIPCFSIFERKKPLAEATQRRVAEGIRRYVLAAAKPFIVQVNHGRDVNRSQDLDRPLTTVATGTGAHGFGLVSPTLVQAGYGEREGQSPRCLDIEAPLGTVVAGGAKHALVAAWLAKHYGNGVVGQPLNRPLGTVTAVDHHSVVCCTLGTGGRAAQSPPTSIVVPLPTVTTKADRALVAAHIEKFHGSAVGGVAVDQPLPTVTSGGGRGGGHAALVATFLTKFYGSGGQWQGANEPLHTIPTVDRFGLVTVTIDGEPYVITDIGLRMLQPRELARAQGFGDDYQLTGTLREQVARIGNSVCPPVAEAIVRALDLA